MLHERERSNKEAVLTIWRQKTICTKDDAIYKRQSRTKEGHTKDRVIQKRIIQKIAIQKIGSYKRELVQKIRGKCTRVHHTQDKAGAV